MKCSAFAMVPVALSVAMALNTAQAATNNGEEDSVYQWGRWEVLSPAAGPQEVPQVPNLVSQLSTDDYDKDYELIAPDEPGPIPQEEDPLPSCQAGATCGFATRNTGDEPSNGASARFNTFSADGGEGSFVLNENESDALQSDNMNREDQYLAYDSSRQQVYGILEASNDGNTSTYVAKDYGNQPVDYYSQAGDWFFQNGEGAESGFFAWGEALPQDALAELNAGSVLAEFKGPMASGLTDATITIQFGSGAFWQGEWTGAHEFQAAGDLDGPSLIQTSITNATGSVEGFVAGNASDKRVVTKVDVITGNGVYKDVGSIPENIPQIPN